VWPSSSVSSSKLYLSRRRNAFYTERVVLNYRTTTMELLGSHGQCFFITLIIHVVLHRQRLLGTRERLCKRLSSRTVVVLSQS
jgi:hypothetical protein